MITKEKKSRQITDLTEKFARSKAVVFTDYKGLTVAEIANLRKLLKEANAEFKVAKNTLIAIAVKGTPIEAAKDFFTGPTAVAFGFDDPVAAAKKLLDYSEKNDKLKIKSGIVEGKLFLFDDLKALSKLPPRNILLGMMAGTFQAPAAKLARALNATIAQVGYALEAAKNNKTT